MRYRRSMYNAGKITIPLILVGILSGCGSYDRRDHHPDHLNPYSFGEWGTSEGPKDTGLPRRPRESSLERARELPREVDRLRLR